MALVNSFFSIVKKDMMDQTLRYVVELNPEHVIYKAHFPEQKVTPGVCAIQIVKELLEDHLDVKLAIVHVKNVKFLSIISPDKTPRVTFSFAHITHDEEARNVRVQGCIEHNEDILVKFSITFNCVL